MISEDFYGKYLSDGYYIYFGRHKDSERVVISEVSDGIASGILLELTGETEIKETKIVYEVFSITKSQYDNILNCEFHEIYGFAYEYFWLSKEKAMRNGEYGIVNYYLVSFDEHNLTYTLTACSNHDTTVVLITKNFDELRDKIRNFVEKGARVYGKIFFTKHFSVPFSLFEMIGGAFQASKRMDYDPVMMSINGVDINLEYFSE